MTIVYNEIRMTYNAYVNTDKWPKQEPVGQTSFLLHHILLTQTTLDLASWMYLVCALCYCH